MNLPYRYSVLMRVVIDADGMDAGKLGAVGVVLRLAELVESDEQVVKADRWPEIVYLGRPPQPQGER